jgi:hypothetical protein
VPLDHALWFEARRYVFRTTPTIPYTSWNNLNPPPLAIPYAARCFVVLFYAPTNHLTSGLPPPTHPN